MVVCFNVGVKATAGVSVRVGTGVLTSVDVAVGLGVEVLDGTTVRVNQELAPNDFQDAGVGWKDLGGLYDVVVRNPDGAEARVPYRFLVEAESARFGCRHRLLRCGHSRPTDRRCNQHQQQHQNSVSQYNQFPVE